MSTQTVFDDGNQPSVEVNQGEPEVQGVEAFADQLAQILNEEGKPKYKDVQTALNALKSSQEYIPALKQEKESLEQKIAQLQEELAKRSTIEAAVQQLKQPPAQQEPPNVTDQSQQLTPEQVQQMLEQYVPQLLQQRQEQSIAETNILSVDRKLKEFYGEKVEEVVRTRAESLGLSVQELQELSARSPTGALELLGVKESVKTQGKSFTSTVNLPLQPKQEEALKPHKSMLLGATGKEQAEYLRSIRERVLTQYGYTS